MCRKGKGEVDADREFAKCAWRLCGKKFCSGRSPRCSEERARRSMEGHWLHKESAAGIENNGHSRMQKKIFRHDVDKIFFQGIEQENRGDKWWKKERVGMIESKLEKKRNANGGMVEDSAGKQWG